MISNSQKLKLQQYLKKDWVPKVLDELKNDNILSSKGKPYSESMIRMVFIGKVEHLAIERAIFAVYLKRKEEHLKLELEKQDILNSQGY